jgi:transposase-like protein
LAALDASGLSVSAWARQTGIAASTLHRWRKRSDQGLVQPPPVFHEVRLRDRARGPVKESSAFAAEVVVGCFVVRAPLGFDEAELRRLLLVVAVC